MTRPADTEMPPDARNVRNYAIVTSSYWAFTLTDGALRMLVLLYLYELGRSPIEIASLFLFYELFGVITNLYGGWLGARVGLKVPLLAGLGLQVVVLLGLGGLGGLATGLDVTVVMVAQALSGIAKDLTKMSSKSYIKLVVPEGDARGLMRWVSWLTGSKNALKGAGFFLGGASLATLGFARTCQVMALALLAVAILAAWALPAAPGRSPTKRSSIFSQRAAINWLAAARLCLFAARDVWFVIALPIFLGTELGWSHTQVGAALATWIIFYGAIQALAPKFLSSRGSAGEGPSPAQLAPWTFALALPLAGLALALGLDGPVALSLGIGLFVFAAVFATNSALHSYLVVFLADRGNVAKQVGFYYSANASGRLLGTLASGMLFQFAGSGRQGLVACVWAAVVLALLAGLSSLPLGRSAR